MVLTELYYENTMSMMVLIHQYNYTAQNKYDDMSLYAFFYYADLYIIVEYGIFLKKIQFPVQWGANREVTTIVGDTAARWMTYPPISKVTK